GPHVVPPAGVTELQNAVGMLLVNIPAGRFHMGSPLVEEGRHVDEGPYRKVAITRTFYLASYPVTQRQYAQVMGRNPSWFSSAGGGYAKVRDFPDTGDFPVENVSWEEAVEF